MTEPRFSRADTATWGPERRSRQRGDAEAVTRGEFSASRKAACEFRKTVTDWMDKLDKRLDTQDEQLSGINEIRTHVAMTCKLVQWAYRATLAVVAVGAPMAAMGKALGWW